MGTSARAALAIVWSIAAMGCASGPAPAQVAEKIATLQGASAVGEQRLNEPRTVSRFYKARESKPAWLGHRDEIVKAIQGVQADGLDPADYHLEAIEKLAQRKDPSDEDAATLDILLADAVASMVDDLHYGRVRPVEVNPAWNADPREGAPRLDSTLAILAGSGNVAQSVAAARPDHFIYRGLAMQLAKLQRVVAQGGWPTVPEGKPLKPGAVDQRVAALRRRLLASGEMSGMPPADSTRYDPALLGAVRRFQGMHRIPDDGVIGPGTVAALNVSARDRLGQVRANLERARWVLGGLDGDFLLVNLPAFKAYLIRGGRNVWESRTQIGEEAMQTPTFRAKIRTVVFNPDWTVPPTIIQNEIVADMQAGKNTLERQGLVIYDAHNNVVDPSSIDWNAVDAEHFPYTLKQPAGDDNALGKVKFLFPNPYQIYLHDTPSRHLFDAQKRTFSHGCIRIEHPLDLAENLLQGQDDWSSGKIEQAVAESETQSIALDRPMPILIVYWTVSVGASGDVHYADDIYHLDPPLLAALDRPRTH
jgi:murein L,D-transpeptidase YcbB/YkuD